MGLRGLLIRISLLVVIHCQALAQQENSGGIEIFLHPHKFYQKFFPNLSIKKPEIDSTYIKTYPEYLTVGTHLILPDIYLDLSSKSSIGGASGAASNFRTNIGNIMAFSASYRFITAGFAVILSADRKDKDDFAHSSYRTATIKYNGQVVCFQFKYIRTRGFTDVNEANSDSLVRYTKRDDLLVKEFQFEGLYNFSWKKYSYYAAATGYVRKYFVDGCSMA